MSPFSDPFGGPPLVFTLLQYLIPALVAAIFLYTIGKGVLTYVHNTGEPLLGREASVIAKRAHVWGNGSRTRTPGNTACWRKATPALFTLRGPGSSPLTVCLIGHR